MGKCDCGAETDWQEIGSTWLCVSCRSEDIDTAVKEMKEGWEKMVHGVRGLQRLKADTLSVTGLLENLKQEISKIEASNK
ncbi:MAG: hypothetical protein HQL08_05980 [Nitrospirae bacterium]|nr:hypothetical protein [Nitrospirota bacterium]